MFFYRLLRKLFLKKGYLFLKQKKPVSIPKNTHRQFICADMKF